MILRLGEYGVTARMVSFGLVALRDDDKVTDGLNDVVGMLFMVEIIYFFPVRHSPRRLHIT